MLLQALGATLLNLAANKVATYCVSIILIYSSRLSRPNPKCLNSLRTIFSSFTLLLLLDLFLPWKVILCAPSANGWVAAFISIFLHLCWMEHSISVIFKSWLWIGMKHSSTYAFSGSFITMLSGPSRHIENLFIDLPDPKATLKEKGQELKSWPSVKWFSFIFPITWSEYSFFLPCNFRVHLDVFSVKNCAYLNLHIRKKKTYHF